ncbi:FadR/GntR family transcriptional regulator [Segnochrobactrum spirostomi]|uniref:FadR family transcriptional regulator n=1 Tax=Segnochrobactrum spirostomi TaxID=2608987 RepID=A0A6A7Y8C0_9HYPH|nr:FCD domain-containing protein [Segnochrobactrum spirostomi]MQT14587.1 FadR family transcriptional regulator [Segnochrobactrum spirostomi]
MSRFVAADIARSLKSRIAAGEWADGRPIPAERDLATTFGVARNTVRRAMALLEEEGAVVRQVGRGTFPVQPPDGEIAALVNRMAGASPADMMEIRHLLEPAAAAFAATNASVAELDALIEAHRAGCAAVDMPSFEHWDAEFHHRIFACSRNQLLKELHELIRVLRNQSPWFEMKKRSFSEERRLLYCEEHEAIVEALRRRDAEAARRAMSAHLETVGANLLGRGNGYAGGAARER